MNPQYAQELIEIVTHSADKWINLPESITTFRSKPEKWSHKEIIGHLIDSACNNHRRFVNAPLQSNMIFDGYAQAEWVQIQHYQNASWEELISLWKFYNLHLANLMMTIPKELREKKHQEHNLHQIAMKQVPKDQPTNLDYLMADYVFHIKHHLKQISEIIDLVS